MFQAIQSPLHPDDEIKAQGLRARLAELQREYQERAQPYVDALARLEHNRRPPTFVFTNASDLDPYILASLSPAASPEGGR